MNIVYANAQGSVPWNGTIVRLNPGDTWAADDPFVKARPDLFSDTPNVVHRTTPADRPVEVATRRPGERRGAVRG